MVEISNQPIDNRKLAKAFVKRNNEAEHNRMALEAHIDLI